MTTHRAMNYGFTDSLSSWEKAGSNVGRKTSIFTPKLFEKDEQRLYCEQILLADTNNATEEQVKQSMEKVIKDAKRNIPDLQTKFFINMVLFTSKRPEGLVKDPSGYAYIWVQDKRLANLLLGRNMDGTPRMRQTVDPTWKVPPHALRETSWFKKDGTKKSWAEMTEEDEEMEQLRQPRMIQIPLPPLLKMSEICLSTSQIKYLEGRGIFGVSKHTVAFTPAHIGTEKEKMCLHTLCCKNVPEWVDENKIREIFSPYVTDKSSVLERKRGTDFVTIQGYPLIRFEQGAYGKKIVYVTFDHHNQNAREALLLTKQYPLNAKTILYFELFPHSK